MLTVEQCQRAMAALDKIWKSLPRSEQGERKDEKEYLRGVLMTALEMVRAPQPRLRHVSPAEIGEADPEGEDEGDDSDDDEDDDGSESPFEVIADALMQCEPEDEREEVWEQAEAFMRLTRLSNEGRAELLYVTSIFHCTTCGGEKSLDPDAPPHTCPPPTLDELPGEDEDVDSDPGSNPIRSGPESEP